MQTPMSKMKVLFLCTGNSCRSQMAEGWARHLKGDVIEPYSAGIEKHGMNPHAVKVMAEAGVDISKHYSKTLEDIGPVQFDYVVTVCGHAHEHCPMFPGKAKVVHVGFDDPPKLTKHLPDGEEKLAVYRRVRDEIRRFVETLPEALTAAKREAIEITVNVNAHEQSKTPDRCGSGAAEGPRGLRQDRRERRLVLRPDADLLRFNAGGVRGAGQAHRLHRGGTGRAAGGREHGPLVRQSQRARRAAAGRSGAGPGRAAADSTCSSPAARWGRPAAPSAWT